MKTRTTIQDLMIQKGMTELNRNKSIRLVSLTLNGLFVYQVLVGKSSCQTTSNLESATNLFNKLS
jgi:hypothetical protein